MRLVALGVTIGLLVSGVVALALQLWAPGPARLSEDRRGPATAPASVTAAGNLSVPSGQPVTLVETIWGAPGPSGLTVRFRFLAPRIGAAAERPVDFDTAAIDMQHLCDTHALTRIAGTGPQPAQIIISLADQQVEFGSPAPGVTQYFEAYRPEAGTCIWEGI